MKFARLPGMTSRKADLSEFKRKRDFSKTPEPTGGVRKPIASGPRFVIQKHDASQLHFDFRLEVDGVLKSWAVPKGPPVESDDRRLAIMVEDHPLDYANFEGVIPKGEYGGGTVMLWDEGFYENLRQLKKRDSTSMQESIDDGLIEVRLHGKRINGPFALKRFKVENGKAQWLLLMMKDRGADQASTDAPGDDDRSVRSDRTMQEIADEV